VWVPNGEDYYGGINDRHAVLPRQWAEVYLRRWEMLTDGSVMWIDPQLRAGAVRNGVALQDENFVAAMLHHFRLPLRRFPAVAFLGCCRSSTAADGDAGSSSAPRLLRSCFSKACVTRLMPSQRAVDEACARAVASLSSSTTSSAPASPLTSSTSFLSRRHADAADEQLAPRQVPSTVLTGKYRSEVELAVQHALALSLPGAHFILPKRRSGRSERLGSGSADLVISAPTEHAPAFRALWQRLKVRAVRKESPLLQWRLEPH